MTGIELLADFRKKRSDEAFAEFVRRYTNFVYSVAKRRLTNPSLAEDVTQMVFIRLVKSVPRPRTEAELLGWLHRTAVNASIDAWRSESRREIREENGAIMHSDLEGKEPAWEELAPVLDEALNELSDMDREAILLRFFHEKPLRQLGASFGVSEDAAKMRVSRALERLRNRLSLRGVTWSTLALGAALAERSIEAAPSDLATKLIGIRPAMELSGAAGTAGVIAAFIKGPIGIGIAATLLICAGLFVRSHLEGVKRSGLERSNVQSVTQKKSAPSSMAAGVEQSPSAKAAGNPDPLKLLQGVAQARRRIVSGSMQFDVELFYQPKKSTNRLRVAVVFDGSKIRFEQFGREYSFVAVGSEAAERDQARIDQGGLSNEEAVQAGLLKGFDAHDVTTCDGNVLLHYREKDGKPESTTIRDAKDENYTIMFDPRLLGLNMHASFGGSLEDNVGLSGAKDIALAGIEVVEGASAWHLQMPSRSGGLRLIWIDRAHPTRVLKESWGEQFVTSKYDDGDLNNPIPIEVRATESRNGTVRSARLFRQTSAQFNLEIPESAWTLAGLGMAAGTEVNDNRIHRRIGYWTGAGLSEDLPRKKDEKSSSPPEMAALLARLENEPDSEDAFKAATWILRNTPDGPEVEQAANVIMIYHIDKPELLNLCADIDRVRPRSARNLLESMLLKNPSSDVRATACYTLATLLKDEADYGVNKKATAEAEKLFERVINEFGSGGGKGPGLAEKAKPELFELQNLTVGKQAQQLRGLNLEGETVDLMSYRGRVVVVVFWSHYYSEAVEHQKLLARFAGKPFTLIGINCDKDRARAKAVMEQYQISWPTIFDGEYGPIATRWNNKSWPSVYVIDKKGLIRERGTREWDLPKIVETLLSEK